MKVSDALLSTAREAPHKAIDMVNALSISTPASKPSYPGPGMWVHGSNRALMRNQQALTGDLNLFEHDFRICDAYAGGAEAMAKVKCPTHADRRRAGSDDTAQGDQGTGRGAEGQGGDGGHQAIT